MSATKTVAAPREQGAVQFADAVGQVDLGQLFYLMARGLTRAQAQQLIVRGFFEDVLERIGSEPVRARVAGAIESRLPT